MLKNKILNTLLQSIVFSIFLSILLVCIRIAFILYIGIGQNAIGEGADFQDYFYSLFNGFLYDNRAVVFPALIYFLLAMIFIFSTNIQRKILSFWAGFSFFISIFLGIANMTFYNIYGNVFDRKLFGLIYDDQKAILQTGLSGDYNITIKLICLILATLASIYIYQKLTNTINKIAFKKIYFLKTSILASFALFVVIILVFINSDFSLKSTGQLNVMNIKNSKNIFLRKITPGAFRNLYATYKEYKKLSNSKFSDYSQLSPEETVKEFFGLSQDTQPPFNLEKLLTQTSSNTSSAKIKHIFYIVSERLSEWSFDPEFDAIGLTSGLKSLIDNKHGFKVENFIENGPITTQSLESQFMGVFQTDVLLSPILSNIPLLPTAVGGIMKKLGYDTRFYYGGSASWEKIDEYATLEGFEKNLYNTDILDFAKTKDYKKPLENEWGVYDNILFDFIIKNTQDSTKPTFNMIMTTSNHPPYNIDLKSFDVPLDKIKTFFDAHFPKDKRFKNSNANVLGHIWWYDKQVSAFIKKASEIFPDSLFIITGDHYDNIYPLAQWNLKITKSVPLILYSPILSPKQLSDIGSHIDIASTIIELVSPRGFQYASFGKPLFSNNHSLEFENNRYALGYYAIGTHRFIYTPGNIEYINHATPKPDDEAKAKNIYNKLQQARALSWWMLMNGNIVK